ncbi:GAF and ANTAR domain-containing protein [Streptomyces sp. ODS28]|uniref:GAF and ANTAR domain-containing protein n=1 Tax=Streptomyces sp. ODS28 TaxID=3136688 RepID=UPI0031EBBBF1
MPTSELTRVLDGLHEDVRNGRDLSTASAATMAPLLGLDSVTVSLLSARGRLELLWVDPADEIGAALDDLQYAVGEGPTPEAAQTGLAVTTADLTATLRWPALADAARLLRARAVVALPLRLGEATIGVLTGYRATAVPPSPAQLADLRAFARVALDLLLQTPTGVLDGAGDHLAEEALDLHRAEVHQAAGMLTVQLQVPIDAALLRLRVHAWTHDRPLYEVARDVIARRLHLDGT